MRQTSQFPVFYAKLLKILLYTLALKIHAWEMDMAGSSVSVNSGPQWHLTALGGKKHWSYLTICLVLTSKEEPWTLLLVYNMQEDIWYSALLPMTRSAHWLLFISTLL